MIYKNDPKELIPINGTYNEIYAKHIFLYQFTSKMYNNRVSKSVPSVKQGITVETIAQTFE